MEAGPSEGYDSVLTLPAKKDIAMGQAISDVFYRLTGRPHGVSDQHLFSGGDPAAQSNKAIAHYISIS